MTLPNYLEKLSLFFEASLSVIIAWAIHLTSQLEYIK